MRRCSYCRACGHRRPACPTLAAVGRGEECPIGERDAGKVCGTRADTGSCAHTTQPTQASTREPNTFDHCQTCGESPDSGSHGPFAGSHAFVLAPRVGVDFEPVSATDEIGEAATLCARIDALNVSINEHEQVRDRVELLLANEHRELRRAIRDLGALRAKRGST